ncbi:MAG: outer membrane protein assembly factor BamA [Candidatus Omnitrophica bacterium]|nr:outer membrane protein assembly factor BamA [Candidatus Omnitrophota bacterium]
MYKKICFFGTLFFFLSSIFALSVPSLFAQSGAGSKTVKEVRIVDNVVVSSATILSKLKTREGMIFSQDILNEDLKRLYALGYFQDIQIDVDEQEDGFIVKFVVKEKPIVESITFEGNKAVKEAKLLSEINIKVDEMLDNARLLRDLTTIRKYYESKGFQLANVDYDLEFDKVANRVKVKFIINEKERIRVKSIDFTGNYSISDKILKKLMVTKTQFLFFLQPGYYKAEDFEADIMRIEAYCKDKGYLDAVVTPNFKYNADATEMYIEIVVNEGKQYLVGKIQMKGIDRFPSNEVSDLLKLKREEAFSESVVVEDVINIQQYYYDRGYMDCEVDIDKSLDPSTGKIDVGYIISEGELIYIDKVRIQGNTKTKDVVIRRELRAYPGEPFQGAEIRKSKERLYNLGYFEEVVLDTEPGAAPDKKDLVVTVKETKTGELSFGGGYSSVDKLVGFVQVNQRNFDALNFPTFTGGGQILNVRAELGNVRQNYVVSWTDPWIMGYPLLFGFDLYRTEHDKTKDIGYLFSEERMGGDIRLGKELTDNFRIDSMYKVERIDISDVSDTASQEIRDEEGNKWVSRGLLSCKYDTRDNVFTPTDGFIVGGSLENAGGVFGGDKDFVKYGIYGNKYISFFDKKLVLELSSSLSLADSYGDTDKVPIFERYYAGGGNSVRGYKERYIGPRDATTNEPIGGNSRLLSSAEITFPLVEKVIKGAVFVDGGEVWEEIPDTFSTTLKFGTGIGARVKTPLGPVKLDYGWPLSDNHDDEKKGRFYFSMSHGF